MTGRFRVKQGDGLGCTPESTQDGDTCFVCLLEEHEYYDLGDGLQDLDNPEYTYCSSGVKLERFTVSKDGDELPVCLNTCYYPLWR